MKEKIIQLLFNDNKDDGIETDNDKVINIFPAFSEGLDVLRERYTSPELNDDCVFNFDTDDYTICITIGFWCSSDTYENDEGEEEGGDEMAGTADIILNYDFSLDIVHSSLD